jgi:lysine-N-methylase
MLIRVPDYFENFKCLAGACPHSCCIGWEVVLDEDSVALYKGVEGPLGEKLRASMTVDAEGDVCFPLNGGRCPFLDDENLCEIHRQWGAEATSITCQEHPRFTEDYGSFREVTLSASCPAANALLLGSEEKLAFFEAETDEPAEEGDAWLEYLLPLRSGMLELLTDRSRPLKARMRAFLSLAEEAQMLLDTERAEELPALVEGWVELPQRFWDSEPLFPEGLCVLQELEILEPDWSDILERARTVDPQPQPESLLERIAVYFAFRYLLKTVNDGDLLSRAQLCVFAVLVIERLAAVCGLEEALRRFSAEVEHSGENLETLLAAFWQREELSLRAFRQALKE